MNTKFHTSKLFWGLGFLVGAIALVLCRIGYWPSVSVFSILFTLFFAWAIIDGCIKINFFEILISVAFLACIYAKPLHIEALTPWTVLGAAFLGSIGLSLIFHRTPGCHRSMHCSRAPHVINEPDDNCIRFDNNFGSTIKYINTEHFTSANLDTSFGEMTVYFDNAVMDSAAAQVELDTSFGTMILYIPKIWRVENHISCSFGAVEEKNRNESNADSPVLHLYGEVSFGAVNIFYI